MGAGALAIRVSRGWRPGREAGDWEAAMDRSRAVGSGRWLAGCSRLPAPCRSPSAGLPCGARAERLVWARYCLRVPSVLLLPLGSCRSFGKRED